jgi:N-methylhydantoinase A
MRVGVDTGGTFTDLVLVDQANRFLASHKLLSTPHDPTEAVLAGMDALLAKAGQPPRAQQAIDVVHGSTVATNALLERVQQPNADRTAHAENEPLPREAWHEQTIFITTAGFEDTLAIARQDRPELYDPTPHRAPPPIPRHACLGVAERVAADGSVLEPLTDETLAALVEQVRALQPASVAISLLHSYANAAHERQLAQALRDAFTDGLPITCSHELLPEYREYERAATCAINGVVAPRMIGYLDRLTHALDQQHLRIMASHGGTLPIGPVRAAPVRTTLSGPAGGVVGAAAVASASDTHHLITLDMGGTSTDVALCQDGPEQTTESDAADLPVRLPSVAIHTVGAGGGSIAWVDPGGALRVGPQSAGADPGPACYGRQQGTPIATVTDAHVVIGHIPASQPLGEDLTLDAHAACAAVDHLAEQIGLDRLATAEGILRIAETTMMRAVQRISLQRGRDPRDYTLMPFGGGGGLHACRLAEALGMERVLVPTQPGVLSAVGMLSAAPRHTFSQGVRLTLSPDEAGRYGDLQQTAALQSALRQLKEQADHAIAQEALPKAQRIDQRSVDLRYHGQSYEITVSLESGDPIDRFLAEHQRLYGYTAPKKPIELVTARWQVSGTEKPVDLPAWPNRQRQNLDAASQWCAVVEGQTSQRWRWIDRTSLAAGDVLTHPTIVSEYSATTVLPPGWQLTVNPIGQMRLTRTSTSVGNDERTRSS